jgi:hypothetical protein
MSNDIEGLIRLNKSNAKPAVEVLVRAFLNYPILQYYFPSEVAREKISYYFLSFAVFTGISYGEVYTTSSNLEGIAVWMPSTNYPVTFWCYLETLDEQNVSLYKHFGFKIVDKSNVPETSLTNWAMLREVQ